MLHNLYQKISKNQKYLLALIIFTIVYCVTRLSGLYIDNVNPDGINWHDRTWKMFNGVKVLDFSTTYQEYHPGVTLMYISAPFLYLAYLSLGKVYEDPTNFLIYDWYAKLSVVIVSYFLIVLALYLLRTLKNVKFTLIFGLFMLLEPYLIGHNRLYHLDYLLTLFTFISFLYLSKFLYQNPKRIYLVLCALFAVLAVLTKQTALFFLIFLYGSFIFTKPLLKNLAIFTFTVLIATSILFPALIVNFVPTISAIYEGTFEVGYSGRKDVDHGDYEKPFLFGKQSFLATTLYYPISLGYQMSPLLLVFFLFGIFILLTNLFKTKEMNFETLALIAFLVLFVFLTIAGKKIDRYTVILFPFILLIATNVFDYVSHKATILLITTYLFVSFLLIVKAHPYHYTFSNPLFGGLSSRTNAIGFKPFGVGIIEPLEYLKNYVKDKTFAIYPIKLGASKSFKAITNQFKVELTTACFDCDYIIAYSQDIQNVPYNFKLLHVVFVQDTAYWYIYERDRQIMPLL